MKTAEELYQEVLPHSGMDNQTITIKLMKLHAKDCIHELIKENQLQRNAMILKGAKYKILEEVALEFIKTHLKI